MPDFEVTITRDERDIREAQKLRFQVFNIEMKKGLAASYQRGLDVDEFDPYCEHLIVRDARSREIVGTYRMLLGSQARRHIGFYSEREFDLRNLGHLEGELLELGRSCARKDFRDKALIPLMWEAIARYVESHRVRFLFGCASLYTTDPREVSEFFALLKEKYYVPESLRVRPLAEKRFAGLSESVESGDESDESTVFFRLPSLIKSYLRIGALVCGPPALDLEFGTADFFLLLDINKLSSEYLRRFGLSASKVRSAVG